MSSETKDFEYYRQRFTKLRPAPGKKGQRSAPYKPLLLISLIEALEQELVTDNKFEITPKLIAIFIKYRGRLSTPDYQADLAQPFYHLSRERNPFWYLKPLPGHEKSVSGGGYLNTLKKLRENIEYGYLDDELFEILQSEVHRNALLGVLINKYFPDQFSDIQDLIKIQSFEQLRQRLKEQGGAVYALDERVDDLELEVRDAAFRVNILSLYNRRCAFCKLQIISVYDQNIVDGAHIKPFAEFRDNRYTNGISLCKNHHWAFDRGWFSISDDYRLIVPSDRFTEEPPVNSRAMADFHGEQIVLPVQQGFYPSAESLSWHRERWNIA